MSWACIYEGWRTRNSMQNFSGVSSYCLEDQGDDGRIVWRYRVRSKPGWRSNQWQALVLMFTFSSPFMLQTISGAQGFVWTIDSFQQVRKFLPFMELKVPSPSSQKLPVKCYSEPIKSSSCITHHYSKIHFNNVSLHYLGLLNGVFLWNFPLKILHACFPHYYCLFHPFYPSGTSHLNNTSEAYNEWNPSLCMYVSVPLLLHLGYLYVK
jgi:hypothetical protein